ncbi:MAG: LysM peptidoglycan-binding domain-containing protein [Rikenellaceae bacterium]|nr:LysM peptidoglycan-binding domain-containing protein [Rikenellaceae bacterium]
MRLLYFLVLLLLATDTALPATRKARKKRSKKKIEVVLPTPIQPTPAPITAEQADKPTTKTSTPELTPRMKPAVDLSPAQADSLLAEWRERQRSETFKTFFEQYILIDSTTITDNTPDSVYINRLRKIVSPIQLPYNAIVKAHISRYTQPAHTGLISRVLGMSQYYFPIIEEELLKADLPVELRALPIIESALSTNAVSPMGAVGLWQFMPTTGKSYGLEINSLVDERRDPVRSTQAACRFLKDLYNIYNDWTLAIAAYNCGPGNVNKALARSGGKTFWEIYDWLPRETRGYVPAFIGATYAYTYHQQHNVEPTPAPLPLAVDTIRINRLLHFGQVASTIDLPIETLRALNPQYKLDIVPATTKTYTLVLPQQHIAQYITHEQEIFAKDSAYLKEYINPANIDKKRAERTGSIYVVRRGDTLGAIARRYRVSTAQLMRWNKIRNPRALRIGQRLRIEGR